MALQLSDMGEFTRGVLRALHELGAGTRIEIADRATIDKEKVSSALNRLESMGLVDKPEKAGGAWTITEPGRNLLRFIPLPQSEDASLTTVAPPATAPVGAVEQPDSIPPTPPFILQNQEIELALAHVRTALQQPVLPALEARIYRAVLEMLPPALSENMPTITRWVNSHGTPH